MLTPIRVEVVVRRHESVPESSVRATNILRRASDLLTQDSGTNDEGCAVTLRVHQEVIKFSDAPAAVGGPEDYAALCRWRKPGAEHLYHIHVVGAISWHPERAAKGVWFRGITTRGGNCTVVVPDGNAANLWAHEFGHSRGLPDVCDNARANAVMFWLPESNCVEVDKVECQAFRGTGPSLMTTEKSCAYSRDIEKFVRSRYVHGIPFREPDSFSPGDVSKLLELLASDQEKEFRPTIVATLAMTGDPSASEAIRRVLDSGRGHLTRREFETRKAAVTSLGLLLEARPSRDEDLDLLVQGLQPGFWTRKAWAGPQRLHRDESESQLVNAATWGLALSGHPEAEKALHSLEESHNRDAAGIAAGRRPETVTAALHLHAEIAERIRQRDSVR